MYVAHSFGQKGPTPSLTLMDNTKAIFEEKLGFMPGDGALHYYLVNWSLGNEVIAPNDLGTILL